MESIGKILKGDVIIVDDEVHDETTDIFAIKVDLEKEFIVKAYETMQEDIFDNEIAFVICDWKFGKGDENSNAQRVNAFLNEITTDRMFPVFICTSFDKDEVRSYLSDGCTKYKCNEASCIFVVNKDEIKGGKIFDFIKKWLDNNPAVKTMKAWERAIDKAKEKLFSDLYNESEYWPVVLYESFKTDGANPNEEMGQFLSRNLLSRTCGTYQFEEFSQKNLSGIDLYKVLEGERTFYYKSNEITDDIILYTGDIFELDGKFYLNVRRQCDIIRQQSDLYLLNLENAGKMVDCPIQITSDRDKLQIFGTEYDIKEKSVKKINSALDNAFGKTNALSRGKFLEKVNEVILPCVCGFEVCRIDLRSLHVVSFNELKSYKRNGRLLEPYIDIVINKFAAYISSKGTMRTPEALLTHKFIVRDDDE